MNLRVWFLLPNSATRRSDSQDFGLRSLCAASRNDFRGGSDHVAIITSSFDLMGGAGFEPAKAMPSDLQSDPFDRSGNPPVQPPCTQVTRSYRKSPYRPDQSFNSFLPEVRTSLIIPSKKQRSIDCEATPFEVTGHFNEKPMRLQKINELAEGLEPTTC